MVAAWPASLFRVAPICLLVFSLSSFAFQPAGTEVLRRYAEQGDKALAEKRYGDAEAAYEKLRQLAPAVPEVSAKLGLIYFQEAKFEQAVSVLRQAVKAKPELPNADILLAMSLSELGRYREALPGLQKGFQRSGDPALKRMAGLQLQRAFTGMQQDDKAVEVALKLKQLFPEDPEVLYHTGRIFGNYAYLAMQKLSHVAPDSVWRLQAAGEAFESQGNTRLAVTAYKQALAQDPNHLGIHYRLGRVLLASDQSNDHEEAAREFAAELQTDPTNANAAYELGEMARKGRDIQKARELFELALKHYPDFEEAHIGLARVLLVGGKTDAALANLKQALVVNRENEVTYFHLAQAYKALGNTTEQQRALTEYSRLQAKKRAAEDALLKSTSPAREVTRQVLDSDSKP